MAKGIVFYRSLCPQLKSYIATENFCLVMNAAFDVLNRKLVNEGVSVDSDDYKVNILALQSLITINFFTLLNTA